ncbi:MAG: sugar kinase [Planctomycetota bacterium]|nr:MAG: sugar kinase [Planctomycetota bacterium]
MDLLLVGSIALDTIETPHKKKENLLGGSATYFGWAASLFTKVHLVGVVGKDFPQKSIKQFQQRNINLEGLTIHPTAKTFRWWGKYAEDMNHRETISVELNALQDFSPTLPPKYRTIPYVFLANASPTLQANILDQMESSPHFVAADTMDLWIRTQHKELEKLLPRIHCLILNDQEAYLLTEEYNLLKAAKKILSLGPKAVVIKKGEHGSMLLCNDGIALLPAFPLEHFEDPTGAGDSFAGGFMGYLAQNANTNFPALKQALLQGTILASFTVEQFGISKLNQIQLQDVQQRLDTFLQMLCWETQTYVQ